MTTGRSVLKTIPLLFCSLLAISGPINAAAAEPVRIGITVSLNGKYAKFGSELLKGVQMWVDDLNERGALLGRPVELVYEDNYSDIAISTYDYETLITAKKVDFLLGPFSSSLTLGASTVAEEHRIPMVATAASATKIWERGYRYIFGMYTPANHNMDPVLKLASEKGVKRVALIYAGDDFPRSAASGVRERTRELGLELVFDQEYDKNALHFRNLVKQMEATKPELIVVESYLEDAIAFQKQLQQSNHSPKVIAFGGSASLPAFGEALGENVEGVLATVQWWRSERMPGAQDFSFRFKRRHGYNAGYQAAGGYAAGQVLEAAIRLAGSTNPELVRDQLATMKFLSLLGHYRVDESGRQIGKPIYVIQSRSDTEIKQEQGAEPR
jgi:branched-chain amino acid transport system substrate-binding protein